jgi:hypothetical protein
MWIWPQPTDLIHYHIVTTFAWYYYFLYFGNPSMTFGMLPKCVDTKTLREKQVMPRKACILGKTENSVTLKSKGHGPMDIISKYFNWNTWVNFF